jgi:hypothetical protein
MTKIGRIEQELHNRLKTGEKFVGISANSRSLPSLSRNVRSAMSMPELYITHLLMKVEVHITIISNPVITTPVYTTPRL